MASKRRRRSGIEDAAHIALETPERIRRVLVPVSWWVGALGMLALVGTGVLAVLPDDSWPAALDPDRLLSYVVIALATASLTGWGCMQQGEARVKRVIGRPVAATVFLVLPLAAGLISYMATRDLETPPVEWPGGVWIMHFARWYTPAVVVMSLLAFITWQARPHSRILYGRGAWTLVLVAPYAVLLAIMVFGLPAPEVGEPLEDSVHEVLGSVGEASIVLQLVIGYFLSSGTPG
jgi:hypothetical protein